MNIGLIFLGGCVVGGVIVFFSIQIKTNKDKNRKQLEDQAIEFKKKLKAKDLEFKIEKGIAEVRMLSNEDITGESCN